MITPRLRVLAGLSVWLLVGAVPSVQAQAAQSEKSEKSSKAKPAKSQASKVKVAPGGSGESAAERSARLRRECKGRPNAGACTGYTD